MKTVLKVLVVQACIVAISVSGYVVYAKRAAAVDAEAGRISSVKLLYTENNRSVFSLMAGDERFLVAVPIRTGFYHYTTFVKVVNVEKDPTESEIRAAWSVNEYPPEGGDSDMCPKCKAPHFRAILEDERG